MPFFVSFAASVLLTPAIRLAALRLGFVDAPSGETLKIHEHPVPIFGGLAVIAGVAIAWLSGTASVSSFAFLGIVAAFGTGAADDTTKLTVPVRLMLLVIAAVVALPALAPDHEIEVAGAVIAVLTVVAIANAANLLDGQDGLLGGLGSIAALGLSFLIIGGGDRASAELGLALAGALAGFTLWNCSRWRIFLGNAGSYASGTGLALLAATLAAREGTAGVLAAGICLAPFGAELLATVARRILTRSPLTAGDRLHSYDILAKIFGRNMTTFLFWIVGVLASWIAWLTRGGPVSVQFVVAVGVYASFLSWFYVSSTRAKA